LAHLQNMGCSASISADDARQPIQFAQVFPSAAHPEAPYRRQLQKDGAAPKVQAPVSKHSPIAAWEGGEVQERKAQEAEAVPRPQVPNLPRPSHDNLDKSPEPDSKVKTAVPLSRSKSVAPDDDDLLQEMKDKFRGEKVVDEPLGLKTYDSYHFNPVRADIEDGHPIAPCAPTHKLYLKRLGKTLATFQQYPVVFRDLALFRREKFLRKVKKDEETAIRWAEVHRQTAEAKASKPFIVPAPLDEPFELASEQFGLDASISRSSKVAQLAGK